MGGLFTRNSGSFQQNVVTLIEDHKYCKKNLSQVVKVVASVDFVIGVNVGGVLHLFECRIHFRPLRVLQQEDYSEQCR